MSYVLVKICLNYSEAGCTVRSSHATLLYVSAKLAIANDIDTKLVERSSNDPVQFLRLTTNITVCSCFISFSPIYVVVQKHHSSYRAMLCIARTMLWQDLRPSHAGIAWKRLNILPHFFHHCVAHHQYIAHQFFDTIHYGNIPPGTP